MKYVATFKNSRSVMMADQACKLNDVKVAVIATPTEISSECGMSLKFDCFELEKFKNSMAVSKIEYKIYERK